MADFVEISIKVDQYKQERYGIERTREKIQLEWNEFENLCQNSLLLQR